MGRRKAALRKQERDELAESIRTQLRDLQGAAERLSSGGLNRKAIVVLLAYSTKLPQRTVHLVLDGMEALLDEYTELEE